MALNLSVGVDNMNFLRVALSDDACHMPVVVVKFLLRDRPRHIDLKNNFAHRWLFVHAWQIRPLPDEAAVRSSPCVSLLGVVDHVAF